MVFRTAVLLLGIGVLCTETVSPTGVLAQSTPTPEALADGAETGSSLRVWLITAGPGDAVWERYGHNAIRVLDTRTGRDVAYNWGIFDFQQADFIPRFLQGRMLYMMAPFQTQAMLDSYERADREIVLQELDLSPAQKFELQTLASLNALPENRDYTYQYFLDNCSTRVRNLLDRVLGGQLEGQFAAMPSGTSYRDQTRRLTQVDPLIYTGMDLLLGSPTDEPISVWGEMFIPMTLRDEVRTVTLLQPDGTVGPLVMNEVVAVESSRLKEPDGAPRWMAIYVLLGLTLGGVITSATLNRIRSTTVLRVAVAITSSVWSLVGGVIGTILLLLLLTDHTFAYQNENIFLFNPLMLLLSALIPLARRGERWRLRARALAMVIAGIAIAGLFWQLMPYSEHDNAIFFALALPAHLGLAYTLSRRDYSSAAER
jgi:hypothetical protein